MQPWIRVRVELFTGPCLSSSLAPPTQEGSGNRTSSMYGVLSNDTLHRPGFSSPSGIDSRVVVYASGNFFVSQQHLLPLRSAASTIIFIAF